MTLKKKIKVGILFILLALIAYGVNFAIQYAYIGSAYDAKMVCSCTFVSHRDFESIKDEDLYAVPFATIDIDEKEQSVTSNIYGFAETKAIYRPGFGCTLLNEIKEMKIRIEPKLNVDFVKQIPDFEPIVDQKLDSILNFDMFNKAINEAFTETDPENIKRTRAIVVLQNGKLIAEKYAPNITKETPLIGWSMTKSITSTMIGLLVKDGKLDIKKQAPITEWQNDERSKITIDHMLRMSSGLDFEENYSSPSDATEMLFRSIGAGDYALHSKAKFKPDEEWYYSSGTSNILQEIIRRQFPNLADYQAFPHKRLFQKLGMYSAVLEPDASGTYVGSSFMFATARDWAKFGQLYLQDGVWNGERILPEGWVKYSSTETPNSKGQYAAHFWLYHNDNQYQSDVYHAIGFEGQYVTIVPSKNLVIVRLGCTPGDNFNHVKLVREIIKAVK
jgi:CubicO group peptidase (beta-lactamase class C family)